MSVINLILHNFLSFIFIISFLVFFHEFGHFIVARLCKVKVEEFSIGFGKKLFSFKDKYQTEWKICLLPFGGYVKMYGDKNSASIPDVDLIKNMSETERKNSFIAKNVYQRIAIVSAGPIANFIIAILIFLIIYKIYGINKIEPIISEVVVDSPASKAGLKIGDKIIAVDGKEINDFTEMRTHIVLSVDPVMNFQILRNDKILNFSIAPQISKQTDNFGEKSEVRTIGVIADNISNQKLTIAESFQQSLSDTYNISLNILKTLKQLIVGDRSIKELGGPIKIAKYSGKSMKMGIIAVAYFMAMISINLAVMNLLPVPVLDGGHLFYYIIEAIRGGKPLSIKVQNLGYNLGLSILISLMVFTTINDIIGLIK